MADRLPRADGGGRGDHVAGRPRHDLRRPAGRQGRPRRRPHHRRGRLRQRGRPPPGRLSHRRAQLALGPLPQPADRGHRVLCHLARHPGGRRGRARANRLPGHRHAQPRPRRAADRARPGDRLGLDRPTHPWPVRPLRAASRGVRPDRATGRLVGAHSARRDRQPWLPGRLPRDADDVRGLLRRTPVPAAVLPEDPRRQPARGRRGAAADDGRLRAHVVRRRRPLQPPGARR